MKINQLIEEAIQELKEVRAEKRSKVIQNRAEAKLKMLRDLKKYIEITNPSPGDVQRMLEGVEKRAASIREAIVSRYDNEKYIRKRLEGLDYFTMLDQVASLKTLLYATKEEVV